MEGRRYADESHGDGQSQGSCAPSAIGSRNALYVAAAVWSWPNIYMTTGRLVSSGGGGEFDSSPCPSPCA